MPWDELQAHNQSLVSDLGRPAALLATFQPVGLQDMLKQHWEAVSRKFMVGVEERGVGL